MPVFTDHIGQRIDLPQRPLRIVSLVPSQTELLFDLGLEKETVGITKFCVRPKSWFREKKRVGGPKSVNIEALRALQPDLVLANKEENIREEIIAIAGFCPVWTSDISTLEQAIDMINTVGEMTQTTEKAKVIIARIREGFTGLNKGSTLVKTAYFIWQEPYMVAGGDTFISDMMAHCGLDNIFKNRTRYPITTPEELQQLGCECVLLSSEPFPFKASHHAALQAVLPGMKIVLADGEMFSWYGSRLVLAPGYFKSLRAVLGF
jgi:ABC-type Fe3+-hydroxamate transport system substrate-binding protein